MTFDHAARAKIAISLLVVSFLISNAHLLINSVKTPLRPIGKDRISLYEKRFDQMRKDLPACSVCGYITDELYMNIGRYGRQAAEDYYLTRYAVSPVLVYNNQERQFVIGNFHNISAGLKNAGNEGLVLIRDYGNGLMLFKGRGR